MENLIGQMVNVSVSKDGKTATKLLKVCKVKARSVLFIEVDKENRINTFRKFNRKDIFGIRLAADSTSIQIKDGVLPEKWESGWDAIGVRPTFAYTSRPTYSNHSKGWAHRLPSTTNSSAGFPMI
jgi:hypothetical protein